MTDYIVLAFFVVVSIVICAVQLGAWSDAVPRHEPNAGDE